MGGVDTPFDMGEVAVGSRACVGGDCVAVVVEFLIRGLVLRSLGLQSSTSYRYDNFLERGEGEEGEDEDEVDAGIDEVVFVRSWGGVHTGKQDDLLHSYSHTYIG